MARLGNQTPRIDIYKPGDTELAELLLKLLDNYGIKFLPWQRLVIKRWLAEDEEGKLVNPICGLSAPRQNGKTELFVGRVIHGVIFREAKGLFNAQKQKTVDVVKRRVQDFFYENPNAEIFELLTPKFRDKPRGLSYIEFTNGSRYDFITRTRMGGLGETVDDLICDEAAEMMDAHQETLVPTTSSAKTGNPQIIYAGTPPTAESVGEVFARERKKILSGGNGAWTEWGVESLTPKDQKKAWYDANPSLGYFLLPRAVEAESESLSIDSFNRMRLGWWSGVEDKRAIAQKDWDELYEEKPEFDEGFAPVYAVKFAPDRSAYSLVVAQPLTDGRVHVEIVMQRPMSDGFSRLTKWLVDRWRNAAKIIIDGATGQAILFEDLTSSGVAPKKIIQPTMKEIVAAHQFMIDAITRGELSHYNQPLLNQTVRITKQRQMGRYGGFGWESMSNNLSTAALDAATYALWAQKVFGKRKKSQSSAEDNREKWRNILSQI